MATTLSEVELVRSRLQSIKATLNRGELALLEEDEKLVVRESLDSVELGIQEIEVHI
jgi:hypothetical protein